MTDELNPREIRRALAELSEASPSDPRVLALRTQLAWATVLHDRAQARTTSEEVLALAESAHDERSANAAKRNLAYIRILEGKYREALEIAREVIETSRRLDDGPVLVSALDISFHCWEAIGDYGRAMEATLETRDLAEALDRPRERAWALANLGSIHQKTGDFEAAERFYEEALELFHRIQYPIGVPRVKTLLGAMFEQTGRWDDALETQVEALALYRDLRMAIGEAQAYTDIGAIHEHTGRSEDAVARYRKAMGMFAAAENVGAGARVGMRLGRLLHRLGRLDEAREVLQAARVHLETSGQEVERVETLRVLASVFEELGETTEAAGMWRQAYEALELLQDSERRGAFERVKTRMEIERAEKDAEIHRLRYVELASVQSRLLESERLAVVGDLAAGVAHEANTPLGALGSSLDVLDRATGRLAELAFAEDDAKPAARALRAARESLETAKSAAARIDDLVKSLKRFAKLDQASRQVFELNAEIQSVLTLVRPKIAEGVELEADLQPVPLLEGAPAQLNQSLMTLLVNAAEATTSGSVRVETAEDPAGVSIRVIDTGSGMSPSQVEHLFEPGFRSEGGTVRFRVGLPTAASVIRRHGGTIEVDSEVGRGTRFELRLPLVAPTEDIGVGADRPESSDPPEPS